MTGTIKNYETRSELAEQSGIQLWHNIADLINKDMVIVEPDKKDVGYGLGDGKMRVWYVKDFGRGGRIGKPAIFFSSFVEFEVDKVGEDQYQIKGAVDCGYMEHIGMESLGTRTFFVNPESPLAEMIQSYNGTVNDAENTGALQIVKEALGNEEQARKYGVMEKAKVAHETYKTILDELRTQKV